MKILFAASECVPFIKTGGLADVVGSLPVSLTGPEMDVRVILPKYRIMDAYWKNRMEHVCSFTLQFGWAQLFCGIERVVDQGVTYYFVDNEDFFFVDSIYGDGLNEGLRFAFFCRAVLEAMPRLDFYPDVLHANDWQTGLIPVLLRTQYWGGEAYSRIKTVFSIHNLKYQGIFSWMEMAGRLGLDQRYFSPDYLEFYGNLNCLKGGIVFSDRVLTVSPTYAEEIKTAYYGEQLDGLLRARADTLSGILNGLDYVVYDPATDRFLPAHFDADHLDGKRENKRLLQQECHLDPREEVPLIGMIARLTPQKGLDLIERVFEEILRCDLQLVLLGKGDQRFVDLFNWANWRYPGRVHARIQLDEGLAHRIYAGSDMFLMPSQFEPCGLSQMIALRYGSVPIVRETGGLKDTIQPYNRYTDEGNGFSFANYNAHELLHTIEGAVGYYYDDKPMWTRLVQRGMGADFSWKHSAQLYRALYQGLCPSGKPAAQGGEPPSDGGKASAASQTPAPEAPKQEASAPAVLEKSASAPAVMEKKASAPAAPKKKAPAPAAKKPHPGKKKRTSAAPSGGKGKPRRSR